MTKQAHTPTGPRLATIERQQQAEQRTRDAQFREDALTARVAKLEAALGGVADMLEFPSGHLTDARWREAAVKTARAALAKGDA